MATNCDHCVGFGSDFTASVGPNVDADQSRKNCQLNIDLQFSPGYQYAVYSADYAGWGNLDSGVKGVVKANYYFSGQTDQVRCNASRSATRDNANTVRIGQLRRYAPRPLYRRIHQAR